jgi:hypothetical protein
MADDVVKRLRYFNGQFLQAQDFNDEQAYHLDRQRRHNKHFHTSGIVHDLSVSVSGTTATVNPGTAVNGEGQLIVLNSSRPINLADRPDQTLLLVISYDETTSDEAQVGKKEDTRIHENPRVEAVADTAEAPPASTHIRLARLTTDAGGQIQSKDDSVTVQAGVRIGDEIEPRRLRFRRDAGTRPEMTSGASGRIDVTGSLRVTGTLSGNLSNNMVNTNALADGAVSISKLSTKLIQQNTITIGAGSTERVIVTAAPANTDPPLTLLFVRASSPTANARFSWNQGSLTSADGQETQQVVVFRNEGATIEVRYEIYGLLES